MTRMAPLVVSLDTFVQRIIHSADNDNLKDLVDVIRSSEELLTKKAGDLPNVLGALDPAKHSAAVIAIFAVLLEHRKTTEIFDHVAIYLQDNLEKFNFDQIVAIADIYTTTIRRLADGLARRGLDVGGPLVHLLTLATRVLCDAWAQSPFATNILYLPPLNSSNEGGGQVPADSDAQIEDADDETSEENSAASTGGGAVMKVAPLGASTAKREASSSSQQEKEKQDKTPALVAHRSPHPVYSITSLHSTLFYHALKFGFIEPALQFVRTDITDIVRENSPLVPGVKQLYQQQFQFDQREKEQKGGPSGGNNEIKNVDQSVLSARYVLLYFYYGGLLAARAGEWEKSRRLFEACVQVPAAAASAIAFEAHKKLVIVSLITKANFSAPDGRSPAMTRVWKARGELYNKLVTAAVESEENKQPLETTIAFSLHERKNFEKDANWGLVKKLIIALQDRAILRVAKSFRRLPLTTLARRAAIGDPSETWRVVIRLVENKKLNAQLDERTQVVTMEVPAEPVPTETDIDQLQERLQAASALACRLDERAQLHPFYVQRTSRTAPGGMSMFGNDDEGLPFPGSIIGQAAFDLHPFA